MTDTAAHDPFADGFLSECVGEVRAEVHELYSDFVDLTKAVNRRAVALQHELQIHVELLAEALGAALYARTLAFTQSSVLMLERGMPVQARTLLRAGLESLFQLAALAIDPALAPKLLASHDADRRTLADRIRRWHDPLLRASIDSALSEVDLVSMSSGKGKAVNIYELAKLAGMEDWYLSIYTLLSFAAHSKVSDLNRHVIADDDGEPIEFQNEPDVMGHEPVWAWVVETQLAAMRSIASIFSLSVKEIIPMSQRLAEVSAQGDGVSQVSRDK